MRNALPHRSRSLLALRMSLPDAFRSSNCQRNASPIASVFCFQFMALDPELDLGQVTDIHWFSSMMRAKIPWVKSLSRLKEVTRRQFCRYLAACFVYSRLTERSMSYNELARSPLVDSLDRSAYN